MKLSSLVLLCASGVGPLFSATCVHAAEPVKKRSLPDYDGRGGPRETPGRKALWVPRVLLFPAYVVSEYVVRRPLGAGVTYAERAGWPHAISDFLGLSEEHPIGVTPFVFVDFGFSPSAGLYAYWDDAGFKGHRLRLRGSTWGKDWLSGTFKERFQFGRDFEIFLKGKLVKRPDFAFYGIGPDAREASLTRYSGKTAYAHFQTHLGWHGRNALETIVGYRGAAFGHSSYDSASLDDAVRAGQMPEPPGFRDGYRAPFTGVRLVLDSRGDSRTQGGIRLDTSLEQGVDLASSPSSGWIKCESTLGSFSNLSDSGRWLAIAFNAVVVDPIGDRPVPFTQLAQPGGSGNMLGLRSGRLFGRSAAVFDVRYSWPIWLALNGSLQVALGNVFGTHFEGFRPERARLSTAIGFETSGSGDDIFQALVGFGTETFESGAKLDSVRLAVGVREGF